MTWFKQISVKEYDDLIKNKNKIYNITPHFTSVELLNKYKDDPIINKNIEIDEKINKQNEKLVKDIDKNLNKYLIEKPDISKYKDQYTFKNDNDILNSFNKIFTDYDLSYKPRSKTTEVSTQYLLNKLEKSKKIPKELFQYFDNNLRNKKKLNVKFKLYYSDDIPLIPENIEDNVNENEDEDEVDNNSITPIQQGQGNLNNIKIDENALNKNILKIRYLNGRKLNNKLLKHDYKISKNMKESIKFNNNIHKLSSNEKNIYYELEKYINKDKSLDILIGSYLSGNNNKKLFNRINKILYDKYKNKLITHNEYTNMLKQINKT